LKMSEEQLPEAEVTNGASVADQEGAQPVDGEEPLEAQEDI